MATDSGRSGLLLPRDVAGTFWVIHIGEVILVHCCSREYASLSRLLLKDDPNEFLIVYGVNHAATGKAVYSNFGVYGSDILNGVGAVASQSLSGTAQDYIPGHPAAKYLYVWKVARRSQGDPRCLGVPWGIRAAGIDLDKECYGGFRAYVEKETKVGPFWSEILYDRTIKFSPSK